MFKRIVNNQFRTVLAFFYSLYQISQIAYNASHILFYLSAILLILQSLIPVAYALVMKFVFDDIGHIISDPERVSSGFETPLIPPIILLGVILFSARLLTLVDNYINEEMGRKLKLYTSSLVYSEVIKLQGMQYFESSQFYDMLRQATNSVQSAPNQLVREASYVIGTLITIFSFLSIVVLINPVLALLLIASTTPIFFAQLHFRRQRFIVANINSPKERKAWYFGTLLSHVLFAKEVRLFNLGDYFLNQFISETKEIQSLEKSLNITELRTYAGIGILNALLSIIIYIIVISQVFVENTTLGDIILLIEAVRNLQTHIQNLSRTLVSMSQKTLYFTHYQNLLALESSLVQYEPVQDVPPLKRCIELRNVSFKYTDDSKYVLYDISLKIHKGKKLALVGVNGAGKTTVVKLLARFYDPTEGQILWDGIDIRHFSPVNLRERLGAVLQDFVKYELSIRENIGLGNIDRINDLSYIAYVAKQMDIDHFISELPDGYDTILSRWLVDSDEQGTDLSGGQWQKIAISRMYSRNVDVLLLDEPTAALDAEAEYDIYTHFSEVSQDRATLLISHRFSTVRMADEIAVIKEGRIIEYGTHLELIKNDGEYAHLYFLQANQFTEN